MTLNTGATLDQLLTSLRAVKPSHSALNPGWASQENTATNIRVTGQVPPTSDPEILDVDGYYPRRLAARFYYWVHDSNLPMPEDGSQAPSSDYFPDAVDLLISAQPGDTYLVLFSTYNDTLAEDAADALLARARTVDPQSTLNRSSSALHLSSSDVFVWIYEHERATRRLAAGLMITKVESVSTAETGNKSGLLKGVVDWDRISFLTALAEGQNFGPVTVTVHLTDLKGVNRVVFALWADGSFSVKATPTHYRGIADQDQLKLNAVHDAAYRIIPAVRAARSADTAWPGRRSTMIDDAKAKLASHFGSAAVEAPTATGTISTPPSPAP
ncbi:hypothetical protein EDF39_0564 [Frondihabitans sp. PhB161]|nr:hypothetical protein EDF37_0563 [Frondihabitans sp. PhB153]RPF08175.1 hypothetical protein EDF39_0564 [Frondihabitans sp. PhB161]